MFDKATNWIAMDFFKPITAFPPLGARCTLVAVVSAVLTLFVISKGNAVPTPSVSASETSGNDSHVVVAQKQIVVIFGPFEGGDMLQLERAIIAQLVDLEVKIHFHHVAGLPAEGDKQDELAAALMATYDAAAAFIITPGESEFLRILLAVGDRIDDLSRRVDVSPGMPQDEALATIVRAATITVIERAKSSEPLPDSSALSSTEDGTPKSPASEATDQSRQLELNQSMSRGDGETHRLYLEAGAALGLYTKGAPPWFGMAIGIGWQPIRRWHLHVGYVFFSKVSRRVPEASLTLSRHPVYLGVAHIRPWKRINWGGGASVIIDYVSERIASRRVGVTLAEAGGEVHAALTGYFHLGVRMAPMVSAFLNLGVEIPLSSTRYGISETSGKRVVLELLPAQPAAMLGFRGHFF